MGIVKAMALAPVALGVLVVMSPVIVAMFHFVMEDMSRLPGCARSPELQGLAVVVRYLLFRIAPVAAGILFWAGKMDNDLRAIGLEWVLRALFMVVVNLLSLFLIIASMVFALLALVLHFSCDLVTNYCIVAAFFGVHHVGACSAMSRLRALKLVN